MHNPEFLHFRCPGHITVSVFQTWVEQVFWAGGEQQKLPLWLCFASDCGREISRKERYTFELGGYTGRPC